MSFIKWNILVIVESIIPLFILINIFPHFILVQPNRISISPDEFINRNTIDCGGTLNPLLLAIHEDCHILFLPLFLCGFLFG